MRAIAAVSIGVVAAWGGSADAATFTDRATFLASLTSSFTDTYDPALGYSNSFSSQTDVAMSSIVGETKYHSTGFPDTNFTFTFTMGNAYCAGCNGSYVLDFTSTSFGNSSGVFGVGLDVLANTITQLYTAFVTYGDGSTENIDLPSVIFPDTYFLGLTSTSRIASIAFGLPNGGTTQAGSFIIDNLTIGSGVGVGTGGGTGDVPEPAVWATMLLGFALVGTALRRQRVRVAFA